METADGLVPTLDAAFEQGGVHLVTVPVDYSENTRVLIEELRNKVPAFVRRGVMAMMKVVRAFDRSPLAELPADDADALEAKLCAARRVFLDRDGWLEPHQRIDILRRLAALLEGKIEHFAQLIAPRAASPHRCQGRGDTGGRRRSQRR